MSIVQLQNLSKSYPHPSGAIPVLVEVNASVEQGESVAIIGPSGSGKSTLLALLAGLDKPTTGSLRSASHTLETMTEEELTRYRAQHLGIVFQQFHLMSHLTALENVLLPLKIAARENPESTARQALIYVGLGERQQHFPNELSGGECQRVAIARAMVANPPIILADEPSGNLDSKTGETVMKLLFQLVKDKGATLILVTHNEELAKECDRRLVLGGGKLVPA